MANKGQVQPSPLSRGRDIRAEALDAVGKPKRKIRGKLKRQLKSLKKK